MEECQEWIIDTSYVAKHRLRDAAIENRQAAIKGLPKIEDEDAAKIMKVILAMRGINKKKQIEAWREGHLQVRPQKLKIQGAAQGWGKAVVKGTNWTKDPVEDATTEP